MAMTINTNVMSLNAQRNTANNMASLATTMQRLSSGLRVNSAKDDAAGLAIATRMDTQVRGMNVAIRNANDGISLAQVAEAGMNTVTDMLQRMRELAVQAINSTNTSGDVLKLNDEYFQLAQEITRTIQSVSFNGQPILAMSGAQANFTFQVGANSGDNQRITVLSSDTSLLYGAASASLGQLSADGTATSGVWAQLISTSAGNVVNSGALSAIDAAISSVNTSRAKLGAVQSRFENTISFLQSAVEQQAAAKGRIMDADFASETAKLSRAQILQQAGTAMIAQANQIPQNVMSLLRG